MEILSVDGMDFLRYDGIATVGEDEVIEEMFREKSPVKDRYEKNGWKRGIFYLENGHAEFRRIMDLVEKFDV